MVTTIRKAHVRRKPNNNGFTLVRRHRVHYADNIMKRAKKKGYRFPKDIKVEEVDLPPGVKTTGFTLGPIDGSKDSYYIGIDKNDPITERELTLAHELGHVHLEQTGGRHYEKTAENIGKDILED